ncbi:hypothetical protein FOMA001_g15884 [Fusarium oxysporum f. sp. matthiolae]|nr:hypothetical protein FOMA001_g15884 [Fusarium oxysporum f. sp. matthiolae]
MDNNTARCHKRKFDEHEKNDISGLEATGSSLTAESWYSTQDAKSQLCSRCAAIDFEKISLLEIKSNLGTFVLDLGSAETLNSSVCPLCRLFGVSIPSNHQKDDSSLRRSVHLRAFSANYSFTGFTQHKRSFQGDTILLAVVEISPAEANGGRNDASSRLQTSWKETGFLCPVKPTNMPTKFSPRLLKPNYFDFRIACRWWNYCCANHAASCGEDNLSSIDSLRVIDCQTRRIVDAPQGCRYVALSYVWGSSPSDDTSSSKKNAGKVLPPLPKTIEDSMCVTKSLSMRYLWVDRYCIDQQDPRDKHRQIQQMDLIYLGAQLTIIAAAGEDPNHGLPGIDGTLRVNQQSIRIGDIFIIQTLPHASWSLHKSRWATRGWTYQEGTLSKRRLIFTAQQVLYECKSMHCTEALDLSLDALHTKRRDRFRSHVPPGSFEAKLPGSSPWDVMRYISQYHQRQLSYPADALNAMRGIFQVFEKSTFKVYNLSGVPIIPSFNEGSSRPTVVDTSATESFLMGLMWYNLEGGERRSQFPSWSWVGWKGGALQQRLLYQRYLLATRLDDPLVWIEDQNGQLRPFPEFADLPGFLASTDYFSRYIHIEAWTIPCSIVYIQLRPPRKRASVDYPSGFYARFPVNDMQDGFAKLHLSIRMSLSDGNIVDVTGGAYLGILLPFFNTFGRIHYPRAYGIVVKDKGECYERVGCFFIYGYWGDAHLRMDAILRSDVGGDAREMVDTEALKKWFNTTPKIRRKIRLG